MADQQLTDEQLERVEFMARRPGDWTASLAAIAPTLAAELRASRAQLAELERRIAEQQAMVAGAVRAALSGPNPTAAPSAAAVDGRTPPRAGGDTGQDGTGALRAAPGYEGGPDRSES